MMVRMMRGPTKQVYFGPDIPVRHTFPEAGIYKLFFQIAPQGKVMMIDFMLEVGQYSEEADTQVHSIVPTEVLLSS
jgi:hypothetical protein